MRKIWICFKNLIKPHHNQNSQPMFVKAIEEVKQFTRPIYTIVRYYGNDFATPWASTMFFVNESGVAVTCKHVSNNISETEPLNKRYSDSIRGEIIAAKNKRHILQQIEKKYGLKPHETIIQAKNTFIGSIDTFTTADVIPHPTLDLAIIKFNGFNQLGYTSYAKFLRNSNEIKQGKSLCRYGYPFAEFSNFQYDRTTDDIIFTQTGNASSPSFPLDGIVTRFLPDTDGSIGGIEMSTPGLKGQSGGPLFDVNGIVCGMQFATNHLHLGFDLKGQNMMIDGKMTKVNNQPFLHVGYCIHVDKIKAFLAQNNIKFYESD